MNLEVICLCEVNCLSLNETGRMHGLTSLMMSTMTTHDWLFYLMDDQLFQLWNSELHHSVAYVLTKVQLYVMYYIGEASIIQVDQFILSYTHKDS
jgi:hypothetical protein